MGWPRIMPIICGPIMPRPIPPPGIAPMPCEPIMPDDIAAPPHGIMPIVCGPIIPAPCIILIICGPIIMPGPIPAPPVIPIIWGPIICGPIMPGVGVRPFPGAEFDIPMPCCWPMGVEAWPAAESAWCVVCAADSVGAARIVAQTRSGPARERFIVRLLLKRRCLGGSGIAMGACHERQGPMGSRQPRTSRATLLSSHRPSNDGTLYAPEARGFPSHRLSVSFCPPGAMLEGTVSRCRFDVSAGRSESSTIGGSIRSVRRRGR